MFKKTKTDSGAMTVWGRPLLWGTVSAALCVTVLLLLAAALCVAVDVPTGLVSPLAFVTVALGAAVGGVVSGKIARKKGWLFGLLCGLCLFLLTSLIGLLCVGTASGAHALIRVAICAACGSVGGIVGVNLKRSGYTV